jgi:hypothetical protein
VLALKDSNEQVKHTALNKLDVIGEQIRFLQKQAREILEDAATNSELHRIPCNFVKVPGTIYHLYERPSGERIWSMISPEEFGASNRNTYLGSYRMEGDRSFTPLDKISERNTNRQFAERLLQSQELPAIEFNKQQE